MCPSVAGRAGRLPRCHTRCLNQTFDLALHILARPQFCNPVVSGLLWRCFWKYSTPPGTETLLPSIAPCRTNATMATIIPAPVVPVVPVVYPARGRPSRRRGLIFSFIGGMIMIGIVFGIVRGIQDAHRNNEPKLERRQFQLGGALGDGRDQVC